MQLPAGTCEGCRNLNAVPSGAPAMGAVGDLATHGPQYWLHRKKAAELEGRGHTNLCSPSRSDEGVALQYVLIRTAHLGKAAVSQGVREQIQGVYVSKFKGYA